MGNMGGMLMMVNGDYSQVVLEENCRISRKTMGENDLLSPRSDRFSENCFNISRVSTQLLSALGCFCSNLLLLETH